MSCTVTFVGDYFALSTSVTKPVEPLAGGSLDDAAIVAAAALLMDFYGWDVLAAASVDITVEYIDNP